MSSHLEISTEYLQTMNTISSSFWKNLFYINTPILVSSASVFIIASSLTILWKNKRTRNKSDTPKKWVKVGIVDQLFLYPIKSCSGVQAENALATPIGLKKSRLFRDRVFMVVYPNGKYLSQTQCPTMAMLSVEITGDQLTLFYPMHESITLEIPTSSDSCGIKDLHKSEKQCRVLHEQLPSVFDCGDKVANWLELVLQISGLRLYFHYLEKCQSQQLTNLQKKFPLMSASDKGAFHDDTSYLLMTAESFQVLNDVLQNPVSFANFRPNIVLKKTAEPFAEESWSFIRIGDASAGAIFKVSMPCTRCKQTTVDQNTGVFAQDGQPLKTLYSFKRKVGDDKTNSIVENQAVMGVHLGLYSKGEFLVEVGNPVYAALL